MRRSVLVVQASRHGPAGRVGELVADVLASHGLAVDVMPAGRVELLDRYGAIVVGGPTRLGRWHREARRFLQRHHTTLGRLPVAVFTTERHAADRRDGAIARALADAPEVEPVTTAHFPVEPGRAGQQGGGACDSDEVRRWADELARELGA
ncbi:MAG TPA: flavodoxin domain-containing protein [Gaiellaceae bacterium]|nr:flavodoxin domain-containing protein [Gaiellaceae bacterium]